MSARTLAELEPLDHFVYVIWHEDVAVYVGMTCDYDQRLRQWGVLSPGGRKFYSTPVTHVDVWEVGPGREHAEQVESDTIRALDPTYNVRHSPRAEEFNRLWAEYSRWAQAYRDWWYDNTANAWALDQATADRICAAVGYVAPDIASEQAAEWERLRRTINAIGPARHEAGAA